MRLSVLILALALAAGPRAFAVPPPLGFSAGESVSVQTVVDAGSMRLADGRTLRLAAIWTPLPPIDPRAGERSMANAARARAFLEAVAQSPLILAFEGASSDRYQRLVAHVVSDGRWIQGEMVAAGMALAAPSAAHRAWSIELLALEDHARRARRGLWADGALRVRDAAAIGRFSEGYAIVEGVVGAVARYSSITYLNFGPDWRSDFSAAAASGARALLRDAGIPLQELAQHRVRVRGEMIWRNGPFIEIAVPEQIEVLGTAPRPRPGTDQRSR
jgi:micrococcal nuclease